MICPICSGNLFYLRTKLVCEKCHSIVETCCDGGRLPANSKKIQDKPKTGIAIDEK